jgi:hypothetical protein
MVVPGRTIWFITPRPDKALLMQVLKNNTSILFRCKRNSIECYLRTERLAIRIGNAREISKLTSARLSIHAFHIALLAYS